MHGFVQNIVTWIPHTDGPRPQCHLPQPTMPGSRSTTRVQNSVLHGLTALRGARGVDAESGGGATASCASARPEQAPSALAWHAWPPTGTGLGSRWGWQWGHRCRCRLGPPNAPTHPPQARPVPLCSVLRNGRHTDHRLGQLGPHLHHQGTGVHGGRRTDGHSAVGWGLGAADCGRQAYTEVHAVWAFGANPPPKPLDPSLFLLREDRSFSFPLFTSLHRGIVGYMQQCTQQAEGHIA